MKNEWKYWIVFGLISILIIGLMTNFEFKDVEVQMHDIYFVIDPVRAVILLACILWIVINFYLLLEIMTERYKIIALFVAIINPLVGLFIIVSIYVSIETVTTFKQMYPGNDVTAQIIPICILAGLILVQIGIQIQALRKLAVFLKN